MISWNVRVLLPYVKSMTILKNNLLIAILVNMHLNPINSAVGERKKEGANHISMICTFSYSMSIAQSQRKLFQQSVLSAFM
mgnify:CR=1 FL=1